MTAGVLLLAACSGDSGSAEASGTTPTTQGIDPQADIALFCQGASALYRQFVTAGITDPADPALQDMFATAHALVPPAEIAAEWQLMLDSVEPVMSGQVALDDPVAMEQLAQQAAANVAAYERVGNYVNHTCGLGTTTTVIVP